LSTEGEHPLGAAHLQHLSQVVEHFLKGLRGAQIQQHAALRESTRHTKNKSLRRGWQKSMGMKRTCTLWSWPLTMRMMRPELPLDTVLGTEEVMLFLLARHVPCPTDTIGFGISGELGEL
jgi:hypothetical protein